MGIFSNLKQMFSSDIKPDTTKMTGLVYPYPLKHNSIKINSKVFVPKGYSFVIGYNGRALDTFGEGEYFLSPATLPECCKRLKIHKSTKKGTVKKQFKANAYFVQQNEYVFNFKTQEKAELGRKASGIFKVGLTANVKIKIVDSKKFLASMLFEFAYLKQNEAEKILGYLTSDYVVNILSKYNFALSEFINSNDVIVDNISCELAQKYNKLGIMLLDFYNVRYLLPKKYMSEYEENLQKIEENARSKEVDNNENEANQNNATNDVIEDYKPYGNIEIQDLKNAQTKEETQKIDTEQCENDKIDVEIEENQNQQQQNEEKSQEFIDLNLDNLYNTKANNGKQCKYCGLVNSNDAEVCELCGNKLGGENE